MPTVVYGTAKKWSDDSMNLLRRLWYEGHSTAEIGRRIGVSKNAVVGKARRMELPARPSPIQPRGSGFKPRPARAGKTTLPTLAVVAHANMVVLTKRDAPIVAELPPIFDEIPEPPKQKRASPAASVPLVYARIVSCCWPIGEPGRAGFRFCDAESVPGKPYCADHCSRAFVRLRDKREDGARA